MRENNDELRKKILFHLKQKNKKIQTYEIEGNKYRVRIAKQDKDKYYLNHVENYIISKVTLLRLKSKLGRTDWGVLLDVSRQRINKLEALIFNQAKKFSDCYTLNQLVFLSFIFKIPITYFFPNKITLPLGGLKGASKRDKISDKKLDFYDNIYNKQLDKKAKKELEKMKKEAELLGD